MHENVVKITTLPAKRSLSDFAKDVKEGLSSTPKRIPSKYFYDDAGSTLFEKIMELEEYYPTRCEFEIFTTYKEEILSAMTGNPFLLADLGAGDAEKTKVLLKHFLKKEADFSYAPIDISVDILEKLSEDIESEYPALTVRPVEAEYFDALEWLKQNEHTRKLVLFMGGNIGNFRKDMVVDFLRRMKAALHEGDLLLIGIDLRKDPRTILRAYDDSKGVTARFNYNLLTRINRELGGDFDISQWRHYPTYDPQTGEVESFLISQKRQDVFIAALDTRFSFEVFEAIHTEYSCKYTPAEIDKLARDAGFEVVRHFYDSRHYFTDTLWRVAG
jgi:dimethylhistidine N-methyltransferase